MNEPFKREYGFLYIVTAEEKKAAEPKLATDEEACICGFCRHEGIRWVERSSVSCFNPIENKVYRRKIEAGEGFEIVPEGEIETTIFPDWKWEHTFSGCLWHKTASSLGGRGRPPGTEYAIAFRRKKADSKFWMVMRLSKNQEVQQIDSLPHRKYGNRAVAEKEAQTLANANPNAAGFVILESSKVFKAQKSEAEMAWEIALANGDAKNIFIRGFNAAKP